MSANADIVLEERPNVLLVPEAAVIYEKDKSTFVEVPDPKADKGKRKVPVTLGLSNGVKTEVVDGVAENQEVVLQ